MSGPLSLRNIPPQVLKLAQEYSAQTGLSINDVFRLALASGILVEVTKVTPRAEGTFCGMPGAHLAKALRRHLASPIDLLIEYGEHPSQGTGKGEKREQVYPATKDRSALQNMPERDQFFDHSIEEDVDMLGIGGGLSETLENDP